MSQIPPSAPNLAPMQPNQIFRTPPKNTLATGAMITGIVAVGLEHLIPPLLTEFLIYSRNSSFDTAVNLATTIAIASGTEVFVELIAGIIVVILGVNSLRQGRFLPPPESRRDHSVIAIVLGFVLLAGVASSVITLFASVILPLVYSGIR